MVMLCPANRRLKSAADFSGHRGTSRSCISAANLYTMPTLGATSMADDRTCSALDHQHKGFGRHTGVGVQHAKLVTTPLIKFHMGGEPARLVSFRG
jgi:hypothetical protein